MGPDLALCHCGPDPAIHCGCRVRPGMKVLYAAVGDGSTATGEPPEPPLPEGGVRGDQSLGGRGSLPAMMSSSCSESMVSHSSKAFAMACILSLLSSISLRANEYCSSMMRRTSWSTFCIVD